MTKRVDMNGKRMTLRTIQVAAHDTAMRCPGEASTPQRMASSRSRAAHRTGMAIAR